MKSRFARTLLLLGALLSAGVLLSVVGTRPSSAQPSVAASAPTAPRPDHQPARELVRRAANPLPNPFDFRAASATALWSAALAPAVVTTIVNYDFNTGTSYSGLTPVLASGVLSGASSTEPFVTFSPGTATTPAAFTPNTTAGTALGMNNSSGANTKYFQFTLGGSSLAIYNSYKVYVQAQRSGTGAQTLTLAYSTDGTNFTNFPTTLTVPDGSFAAQVFDLSLISQLNHKGFVVFRLLASGASGTGTLRIDNFQVQANSVPLAGSPSVAGNKSATLTTDVNGNGFVNPGDTLMYSVVVSNGGTDAMNVVFTDQLNANLTLIGTANASPIGVNDSYSAIGNVGITVPDGAGDLLANDVDPNGNALTISGVVGCADTTTPFVCTTANGGNITVQANGAFTYNSAPGFEGGDFFAYIVSDGQSPAKTDTANVTINVNEVVWFIDNSAVANGDGRLGTPFNSIPNFNSGAADDPGDIIFIYRQSASDYTGSALTLLADQKLIGQGSTASLATSFTPNLVVPPFSNPLPATGGTRPTLTNTATNVTVSTGNTIRGVNVQSTAGTALLGTSFNNLTISETTVNATNSGGACTAAVSLDQASGTANINVTFISVSANSCSNGIVLRDTTGSFTVTGNGGVCTIATPTCTGGTIQNTTSDGIVLDNAQNISLSFTRILNAGRQGIWGRIITGFTLKNSVNVGAGDGDEESGILFENDATTSAVNHTGTPLNGTFLIQDVVVDSPTQWGVRFHQLNGTMNLTVTRLTVQNNINTFGEQGFTFRQENGTANVLIDDSDFLNVDSHIDGGVQGTGTLNMTIQNTVVNQSQALPFGINFVTGSTGTGRLKATGNTLTGCSGGAGQVPTNMCSIGIDLDASVGSTLEATIQNNTISDTGIGGGLEFIVNDNAIGRANISNNTVTVPSTRIPMNFQARSVTESNETGQLHLTIANNTLGNIGGTAFFPGMAFATGSSGASPTHANLMCVNLDTPGAGNNIVNGTTGTDIYAYTFRQRTGTTFQIQGLTGSGTGKNNVQNFINAQHGGGTLGVAPAGSDAPGSYTDVFGAGGTTIVNYTNGTCQTPSMPALPPPMMMAELLPRQSDRLFRSGHDSEVAEFFNAPFGTEPLGLKYATTPAQSNTVSISVSSPQAARWQHRLRPIFSAFTTPVSYSNVSRLTNWLAPAATAVEINSNEAAAIYGTPISPSANTAPTTTSPRTMLVNSGGEYRIVPTAALAGELITINGTGSGFLLPAGESTTVMFNAMINPSFTGTAITNQASVSGTGFGPILSNNLSTPVIQPPTIAKSFVPTSIALSGTSLTASTLTLTLTNPNPSQALSNVAFTDNLIGGLQVAATPMLSNGCGGTFTPALAGGQTSLSYSGGSIPAGGNCTISFRVSSTSVGAKTNATSGATSTQANAGLASNTAMLNVLAAPSFTKSFGAASIAVGGATTLTFNITNNDATFGLTGIGFTDTLPAGLTVATSGPTATCGGTLSTTAPSTISFSGGTLIASGTCSFNVTVTGTTAGTKPNSASLATIETGTNATPATASLNVFGPPTISKSFTPSTIVTGQTSTLNITVTNPASNPGTLTGISFTDTLPAGITAPNSSTSSCGGTLAVSGNVITLTGGSLASGANCVNTVTVTGALASASAYTNTISSVTSANGGTNSTPAMANLTVNKANTSLGSITDSPDPSVTGQPYTVGFTLSVTAPGSATPTAPTGTVTVSDGTGGTCTATLPATSCMLTSTTAGVKTLTITYSGDDNFNTSNTTAGHQVNKADTTTAITLDSPDPSSPGQSVTVNFTVTPVAPGAGTPTGNVTISDSASAATCTASVAAGTCNITLTTPGARTLTATYAGDANFNTSTSAGEPHTVASPPTISKAFGQATIPLNGSTSLTFTINNPNAGTALSGINFTDTLPAGLVVATPNGLTGMCGGTVTAADGSGSISLSGGTLTGGGMCTITLNVTGTTTGAKDNTTSAISATETGAGATSNTATVTVVGPPTISKAFGAATIPLGGTTSLTFTITNPSTVAQSGVTFSDTLPAGLVVATPNGLSGMCGGTVTAVDGSGTISLSGGTLTGSGNCIFSVNVTSTTAGVKDNTTGTISSTEGGTGATSNTASVTVVAPPTISKAFGAPSIPLNGTTSLTFTITNPNATVGLTGIAFTDTLPSGLVVATPSGLSGMCGGTVTAADGSGAISLTGGTLTGGGTCMIVVNVTGTTSGSKNNTTSAITSTNGGTGATSNTATLIVGSPPTVSKAFGAATVPVGGTTSLSFTVTNTDSTQTLTGIGFTDTLPAGLVVATPNGLTGTCGGGTITAVDGSGSISLSGATLPASGTCTFAVNVTGTTAGAKNNTTGPITSTETGPGGTSNTATLTVVAPPNLSKVFTPASIPLGTTTSLDFTITNPNTTVGLSSISFTDVLPVGLTVADSSTSPCGGTLTVTAATRTISFNGGTLTSGAPGNTCTFSVTVTGATAGGYTNTVDSINSTEGGTNDTDVTANLSVVAPPVIAKAFGAPSIALGGTTSLTFTITNPAANTVGLTGVSFTDTLPAGLVVATPNGLSGMCGGAVTAADGSGTISLTGGAIPASGSCVIVVNVTGTTVGVKNNSVTVNSTNGGTGNTSMATLSVAAAPTISKAFGAASILLNGSTSLTFTINNPNASLGLTGIGFTDTLPAGLVVATPNGLTGTCGGGTITAVDGSGSISLSGATLAQSGSCTFAVNVTGTTAGAKPNTTGPITSTESGAGATSNTATLTVVAPPVLSKSFAPNPIVFGQAPTLSFTLTNPNTTIALSGIGFNDVLPAGLSIADSPATAACGGSYTVTAATRTIAFSGGTLTAGAPGNTCTFSVTVTGAAIGAQVNTTSPVTSTEGGAATSGASATLTVNKADTLTAITSDLPDPSTCTQVVTVTYTVTPVAPGAGTPTGNVTVTDGVNSCMGTVAMGQCALTLTTFGNRTLTASYGGDGNFNGSTSAGVAHQVTDTTAPVITCPANQVGVTNISAINTPIPVNYPAPTVTDGCANASVMCVPPSGSNFALGTTTVNCTATDAGSNTAACSFTVTVRQPRAAIKDLTNRVQTYVPPLTQAQANGLKGHLELANTRVEQGQLAQACLHLQDFINQVNSLTPPLAAAQNQFLVSYANKIRNALNCAGSPFPTFRAATVGLYLAEPGEFKLKNRLVSGPAELSAQGGAPEDQPVAGDWDGDGVDTVGVYRQGVFYLRHTGGWAAAPNEEEARLDKRAEEVVVQFGQAGDVPVVGDWNGDGIDTIGVFRQGVFLLRNSNTAGEPDLVINLGQAGDLPLAGDWDGDGTVTVGIYKVASGVFQLRNSLAEGAGDVLVLWGGVDYLPLVGDWDGDGITTVGLYSQSGEFLLRNTNTAGPAEIVLTLGLAGGIPLAGDWDGLP